MPANFFENLESLSSGHPMDDLFLLIKSMTEAEKKHFRQYAVLQGGESNYLRLFNFIDSLDEYSDEVVKATFSGEPFVKQLSVAKNYLNEVILRTFRISAGEDSAESTLQLMMLDIRFLMSRKCLSQVKKLLKRTKKIAEDQENFIVLMNIYALERNLLTEFRFEARDNITFDSIAEEEALTIDKLYNVNTIYNIYCKAKILTTSTRRTLNDAVLLKEFDALFEHPLMQDEKTALSVRAKHWYWSSIHFKHVYNSEPEKDLVCCKEHLALFEREQNFAASRPLSHMTVINNVLEACRATNQIELAATNLELLKQFKPTNKRDEEGQLIYCAHHGMWIALRQGRNQDAVQLAMMERDRLKGKIALRKDSVIIQYMMIVIVAITARNWLLAIEVINILLSIPKNGIREDVLEHAKLLQLCVHIETKQYDIAASLHRNIRRSASPYPLISFLLDYYKEVLKDPSRLHELNLRYRTQLKTDNIRPPDEFPELLFMVQSLITD